MFISLRGLYAYLCSSTAHPKSFHLPCHFKAWQATAPSLWHNTCPYTQRHRTDRYSLLLCWRRWMWWIPYMQVETTQQQSTISQFQEECILAGYQLDIHPMSPSFSLFHHSDNLTLTEASLGSSNIQQLIFDSTVLNPCIGCSRVLEYWSTFCLLLPVVGLILQCCARTHQIMHRPKGVSLILVRDVIPWMALMETSCREM